MHISEGILPFRTCAAGYGVAALITAYSLKKTETDEIPAVAVMGAAFFTASLFHFRVGASSVHLTLLGLTALILGESSPLAILAGLFFQAVMFQHGGISSLGVNAVVMTLPALATHYLFHLLTKRQRRNPVFTAVTAGLLTLAAVMTATALSVTALMISGEHMTGIAALFTISNGALGLVEGVMTAIIIHRLIKIKPEMIGSWKTA